MAEGFLRKIAGERFEASSAGTNPTRVNPIAIRVMAEVGIDITNQRSKSIDELLDQRFDYVITVCDRARETCPVFPGPAKRLTGVWMIRPPPKAPNRNDSRYFVERARRSRQRFVSSRLPRSQIDFH